MLLSRHRPPHHQAAVCYLPPCAMWHFSPFIPKRNVRLMRRFFSPGLMLHRKLRCDRGLSSGGPGPRAVCGTSHLTPVPGANPERTGSSGASPLFVAKLFYPGVPLLPPLFPRANSARRTSARPRAKPFQAQLVGAKCRFSPAATKLPRRLLMSLSDFSPGKSSCLA